MSIFERKKPLAENTLRRIARGIQKFVIDNPRPFIMQAYGGGYTGAGIDLNKPLPTITTKDHNWLIAPFLTQYHSYIDTSNRYGLITSHIIQMNNNSIGQKVTTPLNTIVAGPGHLGEVRTFLMSYYGNESDIGQRLDEPLRTITSKDRFGIVTVAGQDYQIIDIGMRMLEPHELFKAQGFPDDYIIDRDYTGKPYPKTQQVARCGNAVPPPFAEALVRANLPELCKTGDSEQVI